MSGANLILTPLALLALIGLALLLTSNLQWGGYSLLFVTFVFLVGLIFKLGPITSLLFSAILIGIIISMFGAWLIGIPLIIVSFFLFLLILLFLYQRELY